MGIAEILLKEYLRVAPLSRALIRSREIELFLEAQPKGRVIDLGHGDGHFARILERHGVTIFVGVDRSLEELLRARGRTGAHLVVADMERLPFRSGVFDSAMSNCVLEHIENLDAVFDETARVIKGNFTMSVVTDKYEELLLWPRILPQKFADAYLRYIQKKFVHRRYPTPGEWIAAASRHFSCVRQQPYSGKRRQALMDLFLPFVVYARLLRGLFGREVISPIRWPAKPLVSWFTKDATENTPGASANVFLELKKKHAGVLHTPK